MSIDLPDLVQLPFRPQSALGHHRRTSRDCWFVGGGMSFGTIGGGADVMALFELPENEQPVKNLFFFHMLEGGICLACRGFIVLSLPLTDGDHEGLALAFETFADTYARILTG